MTKKKEITLQDLLENMQNMYTGLCSSVDMLTFRLNQVLGKTAEISERSKMEQDTFAEQRKWVGKLCWVWDDDDDERTFTKLNEIIEDDDDRPFKGFSRWKHCEPVKPDDDIIYRGE